MYSINKEKETHYLLPFHRLHQLLVIEMRILAARLNLLRKLILIPADTNNKIRAIKIDSAFRSARMHIYSCMPTRVYAWASERAWRNRAAAAEYRNSLKARLKIQTLPQEVWHAPRQWLEDTHLYRARGSHVDTCRDVMSSPSITAARCKYSKSCGERRTDVIK